MRFEDFIQYFNRLFVMRSMHEVHLAEEEEREERRREGRVKREGRVEQRN